MGIIGQMIGNFNTRGTASNLKQQKGGLVYAEIRYQRHCVGTGGALVVLLYYGQREYRV